MRLNIEEECFSRLSRFVDLMGIDAREALGTLAFLWHDSQDELKTQGTFDEIVDWCRITKLTKDDQERWIKTLCRARFLTEVETGVFLIHGNLSQIDNKLKHLNKSRKGGEATRLKWEMRREGHRPTTGIATGLPEAGHRQAKGGPQVGSMQCNAKQSNYILSDSDEPDAIPTAQGGVAGIARSLGDHDMVINGFDFKPPYEIYPRKEGKNAARGKLKALIKTQKDFDDFCQAVKNYAKLMAGKEKQFIKHFSSFVGHKNGEVWRDYIELPKGISHTGIVPTRVIEREFK